MIRYVNRYPYLTTNYLQFPDKIYSTRRECLALFSSVLVPGQQDTDFIFKELPYILCYVHICLVSAFSRYPIAKNMADALKLYVIASRGFAARLNSIDTNDRLSATHERESIRRDMTDFCKGADDSATIPTSLFYSLTELCRSIDAGEINGSYIRNAPPNGVIDDEADWTGIKKWLWIQRKPPVDLDHHRDTICQFLWCYVHREAAIPTISVPALTSTSTTAQTSNASPGSAPTPRRNITHRALIEGYES